MEKKYKNVTPKIQVDRFLTARYQMSFLFREYDGADLATQEIGPNMRLGIARAKDSGEAIVTICHFKGPDDSDYARFRLNEMSHRNPDPLELIDHNYETVNPNNMPENLTSLPIQTDLAFVAIEYVRQQRQLAA